MNISSLQGLLERSKVLTNWLWSSGWSLRSNLYVDDPHRRSYTKYLVAVSRRNYCHLAFTYCNQ